MAQWLNAAKLFGFLGTIGMGIKFVSPYLQVTDEALPSAYLHYPYMKIGHARDMELFLMLDECLQHHKKLRQLCQKLLGYFHSLVIMEARSGQVCNYRAQLYKYKLDEGFSALETYQYPIYSMYQEVKEIIQELKETTSDICHNINLDVLSGF
jgi:hypothetical protein